ncbi:MAG: hypothetical protein ACYDA6_03625, partial [Solirubrobacteraceae bacterium]
TSEQTATVAEAAPKNTALPTIEGIARVGQTLTCKPGSWEGSPTYTYRWLAEGTPIAGAESSTYKIPAEEAGKSVACEVLAGNAAGTKAARSADIGPILAIPASPLSPAPPVSTSPPAPPTPPKSIGLAGPLRLSRRHLMLDVTCTSQQTCHVRLEAFLPYKSRRGRRPTMHVIGSVAVTLPPNGNRTIRVNLNRVGVALLGARRGRVRALLAATVEYGDERGLPVTIFLHRYIDDNVPQGTHARRLRGRRR